MTLAQVSRPEGRRKHFAPPSHHAGQTALIYDALPFVCPSRDGSGRDFWAPRPTGDYAFDCSLGQLYADAMLPILSDCLGFNLLTQVVLGVLDHGNQATDRGVVVGMFGRLSDALVVRPGFVMGRA